MRPPLKLSRTFLDKVRGPFYSLMFLFVSNPTQVFMVRFRPSHPAAAHWACAYFFATCGVAYGTVMSRIPAIKGEVGLNEAELGSAPALPGGWAP